MTDVPLAASADLGETDWEQRLIRALRSKHYQWRTEQTYRQWSWRFQAWLERRQQPIKQADETEVREYLTELATRQRVSASTQKQALNALVFLFREGLQKELGAFGTFKRAHPSMHIPTVLSRDECRRLFDALDGTSRLMAELMYGSGLRLTELLRLRGRTQLTGSRLPAISRRLDAGLSQTRGLAARPPTDSKHLPSHEIISTG